MFRQGCSSRLNGRIVGSNPAKYVSTVTPLHPTSSSERIDALDGMRGMAILGVLLAYTVWSLGSPPEETWSGADRAVAQGMGIFVDNKFLSMFAFLFGMGVAQQWRRWEAAGFDPLPLHLRRMGFLLGIGVLHAVLLRNGDILVPYALLGLMLLLFRAASIRIVAITAPLLFIIPYVVEALRLLLHGSWPARPGAVAGGYLAENLAWLRYWYETNPLLGWPQILSLMLLGLLAGRAQLVERFARSRDLARRALVVALPLAIGTRLAYDLLLKRWTTASPTSVLHNSAINALSAPRLWRGSPKPESRSFPTMTRRR